MSVGITFNGRFTMTNRRTREHRTFRIRTQSDKSHFAPGKRILALLTGPDNTSHYKGFAFVKDDGITVWEKNRGRHVPSVYDHYAHMIWEALTDPRSRFATGYTIEAEKRCRRCNRVLTHPESLQSGLGPECSKK